MSIHILPPEVASQIAAGEVVERPASVVKELLENALDAGARFITITVEAAGRRMIEVADDGCGIPAAELGLAVSRHATSKLAAAADLFHILTLGFRGEALNSISAVARLTLTSRPTESASGARLRVEGGYPGVVEEIGAPPGTVVRVEDLFYNVPARLKFLKSDLTERRQIDELVTRYALAYPKVRFHLIQDGRSVLQTSGNGDRREILAGFYGMDVARQMVEVLAEHEEPRITGFISPISLTRSNRREITFFANGRWIHDTTLTAALIQAYHTLLMVGRYPMACLFLELDPQAIDVNIHPAKAEVRFRDRDRVFSVVQRVVRRTLLAHAPAPGLDSTASWELPGILQPAGFAPGRLPPANRWAELEEINPPAIPGEGQSYQDSLPASALQPSLSPADGARPSLLRLIGQIASAYLVAEGPDGLYLIDQHAAHERILFEQYMTQLATSISAQVLLEPAVVTLAPASARLLTGQLPFLDRLGFRVEEFGSHAFLVRALPALLSGSDPAAAVRVLVEDFEEDETPLGAEAEARIVARVCKRAAVKAGQSLSPEEQRVLLADLERCQSPRTCPHGRPTMIHLSVDLLERQFGRKGARS